MLRHRTTAFVCVCLIGATAACNRGGKSPAPVPVAAPERPDARVRELADAYLEGFFQRNPDQVTLYGVPGRHHDALPDNGFEALRAWQAKEDAWLAQARQIDPATIEAPPLRGTYAIVREALESSIGVRVCRSELWTVSQFVNGWQVQDGYTVTIQPVGTDEARKEALARWSRLPQYVDTEIANLRDGLKAGYSAPKGNVRLVIGQMDTLIAAPTSESPFDSPSVRDQSPEFVTQFDLLVREQIVPAFKRYRDFLQKDYLPAAREAIGVSANPNGAACYDASVRYHSSLPMPANEVHALGLREVEHLDAEMKAIGERSFGVGDVPMLLQRARTEKRYLFKSPEDLIARSQLALSHARGRMHDWFGLRPKADVVIQRYPKFREKNGPNEYNPPAEDGSRPAVFLINAYEAGKKSRVGAESTAFHETIPGHHLQIAIALERKDIHPIGRYLGNSGYTEGWALYAERLADEMKLFSTDLDRLGMLSSQALRASRLVVDSGMHTLGWTRQQAIDFMLVHTAEDHADVVSEVDRYIIAPGQATAYMLGKLEIDRAREDAQRTLAQTFNIKSFHDRVLEDGAVPVSFLREKIRAWAAAAR